MAQIRYEQAVYGSFPFWDRGYALLARSDGCRPEWIRGFEEACQRYGEPPPGLSADGAAFATVLPNGGPWLVVGVGSTGRDDRGRPGALAFHGLFVHDRELRRARAGPLVLLGALRREWGPESAALMAGTCKVETSGGPAEGDAVLADRLARALAAGRRVAIEATEPITDLALAVARAGGDRLRRRRCAIATLTFSDANHFGLFATPQLDLLPADPALLTLDRLEAWDEARRRSVRRARLGGLGAIVASGIAAGLWWRAPAPGPAGPPDELRPAVGSATGTDSGPPTAIALGSAPVDREERQHALDGLLDLALRCGVEVDPESEGDPTALMLRLAAKLRYRGPWLSEPELTRLRREGTLEAGRVLRWHEHLGHFRDDRPLPASFARGGLAWQLATLAWSFHVEPGPDVPPAEIPFSLADALAVPGPVRPGRLAARYPAVQEYARFLGRLPQR